MNLMRGAADHNSGKLSTASIPQAKIWSTMKNRTATIAAMIQTITVVSPASLRVGQTTLAASERTWATNWAGLIIYAHSHLGTLAGVEGLEPPALGFGDRCSTN